MDRNVPRIAPIPDERAVEVALDDLVANADAWLDDHAEQFDPLVWSDAEIRFLRRKAFAEAGMYLQRAAYSETAPSDRLRSLVLDHVNEAEYRHLLARSPQQVAMFGYPVAYADDQGALAEATAEAFERTVSRPDLWASEVLPFRKLDLLHLCRLYGQEPPVDASLEDAVGSTCAVNQINPATVSMEDTYGLTHVLMYYQNFGSGHERFPDEPIPYRYPATLHGLLLRYMAADNCDLVGELLLCGALEKRLPRGLARFALAWYLDHVSAEGYVPHPGDSLPIGARRGDIGDGSLDLDMGSWDDESEAWAKHYHPTLIGATLGRVLLDRWSEIDALATDRSLDYEAEAANLLTLGRAFDLFADYQLEDGAELIRELGGTATAEVYADVVDLAVQFLEWQRRPDDRFGFWTDEKTLFVAAGDDRDADQFRADLVDPLSALCEDAIAGAERTRLESE